MSPYWFYSLHWFFLLDFCLLIDLCLLPCFCLLLDFCPFDFCLLLCFCLILNFCLIPDFYLIFFYFCLLLDFWFLSLFCLLLVFCFLDFCLQIESIFFTWPKLFKKKIDIIILNLLLVSILSLGRNQTENTQIRIFANFQLDHFPKLKIDSKSRFEKRMSIFPF